MEKELDIPKDRPTILVENILGDRKTLGILLSQSEEKEAILDKTSSDMHDFDDRETRSFVKTLMNGLGKDDEYWDVNKRDGAIELLYIVDLDRVPRERLLSIYLDAVSSQNKDSDPWGSIYSLIDAGEYIAPYLPFGAETRQQVARAWIDVASHFAGEENEFIDKGAGALVSFIPLGPEDLNWDEGVMLGGRERPRFDPAEQALHYKYLEITKKQKTFKLALWENTPQFRLLCQSHGIELERFWNINNPDDVAIALQNAQWEKYPQARDYFNKALEKEAGVNLTTLSLESSRVLADEIVKAADKARVDVTSTVGDFGSVVNRFKKLMEDVKEKGSRAQRVVTSQISNFFRENGVIVDSTRLESVIPVLNDAERLKIAEATFTQRQQSKKESAVMLENTFKLKERSNDFTLVSRQREDLFLGDLTGDCTSYHLYIGMNAWTVPIWLSNPGFNIYKITDNDQLVAKLGVLLAAAEDRPVLVVDSFEVGQGIPDQQAAIEQIKKGLTHLRGWAERIGIEKVLINTVSNSSGAADLVRDADISEQSYEPKLHILGGLSGVSELRQKLIGEKADERIYLQSRSFDFEQVDVHTEETTEQQAELTREFEKLIGATINKARPEDRGNIEDLARSQNWVELFKFFIDVNYPTVSKTLGNDWERYRGFMDVIEIEDTPYRVDADSKYIIDQFPVSAIIEEQFIEEAARQDKEADDEDYYEEPLVKEADRVDGFLITLKLMENVGLSPEMALRQLYGQTTFEGVDVEDNDSEGANKLGLNRNLPKLVI